MKTAEPRTGESPPTSSETTTPSTFNPYLASVQGYVRLSSDEALFSWRQGAEQHFEREFEAYQQRPRFVDQFSWAVPNEEALAALAKYQPLVEIGAGNGYWARLLRERGVDIVAYDLFPPNEGSNTFHSGEHVWTEVLPGGHEKVSQHQDRALFLCWPPYLSPMANNALRQFKGQHVIYVGEWMACTADDEFHNLLLKDFEEVEQVGIPSWPGIHDNLAVWQRK